jgi:hypothetical protein
MIETEEYYNKLKPTDRNVTITTEALYKKYFRSKKGKERRWFILQEFPTLTKHRDGMKVELWFMDSHELVKIEVLKFIKLSNSDFEKVALAAFL